MRQHLTKTQEDLEVKARLWVTLEREALSIASRFSELDGDGLTTGEDYLDMMKQRGCPKTVIRGLAMAAKPETVQSRLDAYRMKLGLPDPEAS